MANEADAAAYPVVIVGGGLSGLTAAYALHRVGIDFVLLEARGRLGGRVLTVDAAGAVSDDGFDLGPSWFWPDMQPAIATLVTELGLKSFGQQTEGDVMFHRMSRERAQRYRGVGAENLSMRLAGGTGAIIAALAAKLPLDAVRLGAQVERLVRNSGGVDVFFRDEQNRKNHLKASRVVLAAPPRLLNASVSFEPRLGEAVARRWNDTPTWMAPHAKFFAVYDRPFWREAGLSGTAQSMVGPMVEIHDATTTSGKAALFGFLGVPAAQRAKLERDVLTRACVDQLVTLFGPDAAAPSATLYKDWAIDTLTATDVDTVAGGHPATNAGSWVGDEWSGRIVMAGSETSEIEPGYLSGAVHAGMRAAAEMSSTSKVPE